ncbi:type II secretion system protein GspG [Lysobacter enzymogenes]|uniref:type II secretion system protein GspG n=1 Tax=Lysobacter enzymogenes TaxID=69 RepID=UPI003851403D
MSERNWKIAAAAVLALAPMLLGVLVWRVVAGPGCTRTDHTMTRAQVNSLGEKVRAYRCDTGFYPESLEALAGGASPLGPYAKRSELIDAWGRPVVYLWNGKQERFAVFSLGSDGLPGGEGQSADIVYDGSLAPLSSKDWYRRGQPVQPVDCSRYKPTERKSLVLSHMKAESKDGAAKAAPGD